jgi:phosphoglycerol transferase MdoB-like AlkP superfamily enzyme
MQIISRRKLLKDHLVSGIMRYLAINLLFLILLVLARIYEYFFLKYKITIPSGSLILESGGVLHDILMLFNLSAWFILPFLILYLISKRLAGILSGILIALFIIVEIALIQYLGATSLLLGLDLFGYSLKEVVGIASAGGGFSLASILPVTIGVLLMIALYAFAKHIKPNRFLALVFVVLSFISLGFRQYTIPDARKFDSELTYNLMTNKAYHIFSASWSFLYPDESSEASLFNYFYTGLEVQGKSFQYISDEYPFLRKDDTPDILGKYFNTGTQKPNLVFLIVESLGRAYSGEGAYLKSFTPFLDSLENHSLYWENVMSTAGRTFEVLPSVFGSMPYGTSGFAEMGPDMPEGMSLISLLKERGYESRFFYGGDASFDNMKMFLNKQHIDYVIEEKDFGPEYKKMPVNSGNFTWGYGEKDIFKKGFEILANAGSKPRLDIYLTLAMHDPYRIPDQDYYNERVEKKFITFKFNEAQKREYRKYLPNYASVLYFDDALRSFFDTYQKRKDFRNTIFIITGDHRMSSPPISTQIDRFHVPLIIFSPMLKSTARFSSVVSHLDFTPSVVAFLKRNYGMSFPAFVPWIGQGLDSLKTFRNTRSVPFIRTKNEIIDYIDRDYFIVNNQLFKVSENLSLDKLTDEKKLIEIQRKFDKFKTDNLKACLNNTLIPDSLKFRLRQ